MADLAAAQWRQLQRWQHRLRRMSTCMVQCHGFIQVLQGTRGTCRWCPASPAAHGHCLASLRKAPEQLGIHGLSSGPACLAFLHLPVAPGAIIPAGASLTPSMPRLRVQGCSTSKDRAARGGWHCRPADVSHLPERHHWPLLGEASLCTHAHSAHAAGHGMREKLRLLPLYAPFAIRHTAPWADPGLTCSQYLG